MDFDLSIKNGDLMIYSSYGLESFAREFVDYYNTNIEKIKKALSINKNTNIIVALTDEEKEAAFTYGKSAFSGIFTDTGAFAYINLNGGKTKEYMFKGLMHELIHHLYAYHVYGTDKKRITWVDEGLAQFFSNQKEELKDELKYHSFLKENLDKIQDVDLNLLNHKDKSFGNNNGYNLSYIAIRYLYETNSHENFIKIIKNQESLLELGSSIIKDIKEHYCINNKTI